MDTCKKCVGDGLIGAGEFPHLKQGRVETCDMCGGTGKTASEVPVEEAPVEATPEAEVVETVVESEVPEVTEALTEEKKSEDSEVGSEEVSA